MAEWLSNFGPWVATVLALGAVLDGARRGNERRSLREQVADLRKDIEWAEERAAIEVGRANDDCARQILALEVENARLKAMVSLMEGQMMDRWFDLLVEKLTEWVRRYSAKGSSS